MDYLLEAFKLIEENKEISDFDGLKSEELITLAEQALGLKFPPTYRLFLKKYGSGGMDGFEIYGLTKNSTPNFENGKIPNGIWLTLDERKTGNLPPYLIIIASTGDGFYYALDGSQANSEDEYPVVIWGFGLDGQGKEKVNTDFGEFLLEHIQNALKEGDLE